MPIIELVFTQLIPIILVTIMFGMGLSLTVADFERVVTFPKAAIVGLFGQLALLPAIAFALALLLDAPPAIAAGGMLLAACPGGVTSNGYVFVSRGDVGLSVTLTAVASVVTIFTIPLITSFGLGYFYEAGDVPQLPALRIIRRLIELTALPVIAGMLVRHLWPQTALRGVEFMRRISLLLLIVIIVSATMSSLDKILEYLPRAGLLAACMNLISMTAGYWLARTAALPRIQARTITFEIGVQNLAMALLIAITILERPELSILAVVYAFVMKISALILVYRWRGSNQLEAQPESGV